MKRHLLTFGPIAGLSSISLIIFGLIVGEPGSFMTSEAWGFASMLVAFSVIFVAMKRFRDKDLGGVITFSQGMVLGLGVTLLAGLTYAITWELYLGVTDYRFLQETAAAHLESLRTSGASVEEIASFEKMMATYDKLWFRLPITLIEVLPVGLLVTLVSAGILRNPRAMAA